MINSIVEKITKAVSDIVIKKITLKDGILKLQIQLEKSQNAAAIESVLSALLPEYTLSIAFFMKDETISPIKKIIGVSSGKGGVGKSTIALHLAYSLKEMGHKVAILDADIYAPSIPSFLNVYENPRSEDGRLIDPIETHGFRLLSMGLFLKENQSTLWKSQMLVAAFNQFLEQGNWSSDNFSCDYLIIDLPPGTTEIHMALAKIAPHAEILLVGAPNKIVYVDVNRMYITCRALNLKVVGLVENMAYHICSSCAFEDHYRTKAEIKDVEKLISLPIFHHFHDLAENGYPQDYAQGLEKSFFDKIAKKLLS